MNRRSFFSTLLKGAAAFTILPGAGRVWKVQARVPDFSKVIWTLEPHPMRFSLDDFLARRKWQPTLQDYLAAAQRSSKHDAELMAELFTKTKTWPPNMGETKRLVYGTADNIARSVVQSSEPNSRPIYVGTLFPT